jgi:hypothetical protein
MMATMTRTREILLDIGKDAHYPQPHFATREEEHESATKRLASKQEKIEGAEKDQERAERGCQRCKNGRDE